MSLVGQPQFNNQAKPVAPQGAPVQAPAVAQSEKDAQTAKRVAAMKEAKKLRDEAVAFLIAEVKAKYPQGLPANVKPYIDRLEGTAQKHDTDNIVFRLFSVGGAQPVANASITATRAFGITGHGPSEIKRHLDNWTKKGVVKYRYDEVKSAEGSTDFDKSTFVLLAYTL